MLWRLWRDLKSLLKLCGWQAHFITLAYASRLSIVVVRCPTRCSLTAGQHIRSGGDNHGGDNFISLSPAEVTPLRPLLVLPEHQQSFATTPWLTTAHNGSSSSFQGSVALFWPSWAPACTRAYTHALTCTRSYTNKSKVFKGFWIILWLKRLLRDTNTDVKCCQPKEERHPEVMTRGRGKKWLNKIL